MALYNMQVRDQSLPAVILNDYFHPQIYIKQICGSCST